MPETFQEKFNAVKEGVKQLQEDKTDLLNALQLAYHWLVLQYNEEEQFMHDIKAVIEGSREGV